MAHWNYRVVKDNFKADGPYYSIREVYYDSNNDITLWSVDDMAPHGETAEALWVDIQRMSMALDKATLILSEDGSTLRPWQ
jgi:hypothetical protein